jgi:RimJ/RimL family protein N-acetyltransferase
MLFETDRLFVRHWLAEDLKGLHELYGDPAIMQFIRPVLTIEETKQIFDEQLIQYQREPESGRYMIIEKLTGEFVGIFMLRKPVELNGIEIGYSFRKQDWGKGYATEIVKKGIEFVFSSTAFDTIYAFTDQQNLNSKNVLEKCGFIYRHDISEDGRKTNLFSLIKLIS